MRSAKRVRKNVQKTTPAEIPASFEPVVAAFAGDREVGLGKMFSSNAVLNVNGKIFAMQVKGKLVVKLPKQRVDELVAKGKGEYFDPGHGRLMKEWASVDAPESEWVGLAKEAYRFVNTGKP
jgi:TfoX/Sxy family transcriptional regulator of competence genes